MSNYLCYCIRNENENKTYIGITNNFKKRIRQHNGILSGGAKYTHGDKWSPIIILTGFISKNQVLRFEYLWKKCKIKTTYKSGIMKRLEIMDYLFSKNDEWSNLIIHSVPEIAPFIQIQENIHPLSDFFS
jgi:predicted GIY-YIG superfamily endonuclease